MSSGRTPSSDRPPVRTPGYAPSARTQARRRGPHIGPVGVTPARVFLVLALAGGLGFLGWSVFVRDTLQVPLMATGFAICGIVFGLAALMAVGAVVRAGREGRDGFAVASSLFGGLLAIGSLLCLAAAVIMSMIWGGTTPG